MHRHIVQRTRIAYIQGLRYSKSSTLQCSVVGLYGLSDLRDPDDFILLANQAINKCKALQHDVNITNTIDD